MSGREQRTWPLPALVLVTDIDRAGGTAQMIEIAREAVAGGVNVVQVREKSLAAEARLAFTDDLHTAIDEKATLIVNFDIAAAITLDIGGVHLPEALWAARGLASVRESVGGAMLISCAVHSTDAAARAAAEGADIVQIGTAFETASKPGAATIGEEGVRAAVAAAGGTPVIAIGGISVANVGEVMSAGAAGIAVIGAIVDAADPRAAAAALRAAMAVEART